MLAALLILACSGSTPPDEAPGGEVVEAPAAPVQAPAGAPDVVLVVLDTLRADHLGVYGYPRETAPFLTGVGARGAVFERAWSVSSWTAPSTASVFTGLVPPQHGVEQGLVAVRSLSEADPDASATLALNRLPGDLPTLPEILQGAGWRTFGLAANINIGEDLGFTRGFDQFHYAPGATAGDLAQQIVTWKAEIEGAPGAGPSFLYLHLNDPHSPYNAREPWVSEAPADLPSTIAAYDSEIRYADLYLGRLYELLGWGEDTLLIVVSDHGEAFGEHGANGHGFRLYAELTRSVWLIEGPGVDPVRVPQTASLVDVLPTTLDLLGLPAAADREGRSLAPALRGEPLADRPVFGHRLDKGREIWAAAQGDRHLIEGLEGPELYDLAADPLEENDLYAADPARAADLAAALDDLRARVADGASEEVSVTLDADALEHLRALGYVE